METEITEKVLSVVGFAELTAANSKLFRKRVCGALNGHTVVEIDLSETTFMDCTGLGALIAICNLGRGRRTRVRLVNPTSQVQQLLHLMRAAQILQIIKRPQATTLTIPLIEASPRRSGLGASLAREAEQDALESAEGLVPAIC